MSNRIAKKNEQINEYKTRCIAAETVLNTMKVSRVEVSTNTESDLVESLSHTTTSVQLSESKPIEIQLNNGPILVESGSHTIEIVEPIDFEVVEPKPINSEHIQTQPTEPDSMELEQIGLDIQTLPIEMQPFEAQIETVPVNENANVFHKHKCPECNYSTDKLDTLKVHQSEFCVTPPIKNRTCKFCCKTFTRRGLRVHMNQFVTGKHQPKGKHKDVSLVEHKAYLNVIKAEVM